MRAGSNWRHLNGLSLGMMGDPVRCLPKVVHPDVAALKLQHNQTTFADTSILWAVRAIKFVQIVSLGHFCSSAPIPHVEPQFQVSVGRRLCLRHHRRNSSIRRVHDQPRASMVEPVRPILEDGVVRARHVCRPRSAFIATGLPQDRRHHLRLFLWRENRFVFEIGRSLQRCE